MLRRRGSIFLFKNGFTRKNTRKGKVWMPGTKNGDTLGEAMNLCKKVSKHKNSENGNTCSA
jgi:hypothetical protein